MSVFKTLVTNIRVLPRGELLERWVRNSCKWLPGKKDPLPPTAATDIHRDTLKLVTILHHDVCNAQPHAWFIHDTHLLFNPRNARVFFVSSLQLHWLIPAWRQRQWSSLSTGHPFLPIIHTETGNKYELSQTDPRDGIQLWTERDDHCDNFALDLVTDMWCRLSHLCRANLITHFDTHFDNTHFVAKFSESGV